MNICILGRGILADAVAHCCAVHFEVDRMVKSGHDAVWVCHDTTTSASGEPNMPGIIQTIVKALRPVPKTSLVIISSQLRVGTMKAIEAMRPDLRFVYVPENVRVATARDDFHRQARIIVGRRTPDDDAILDTILNKFTETIILTDTETAEFCKTALNGFLALQIAYANELATLCEKVGADMTVVTRALLSDRRVSPLAPLRAGAPYAVGHLGREVFNLMTTANDGVRSNVPLIGSIAVSNNRQP